MLVTLFLLMGGYRAAMSMPGVPVRRGREGGREGGERKERGSAYFLPPASLHFKWKPKMNMEGATFPIISAYLSTPPRTMTTKEQSTWSLCVWLEHSIWSYTNVLVIFPLSLTHLFTCLSTPPRTIITSTTTTTTTHSLFGACVARAWASCFV